MTTNTPTIKEKKFALRCLDRLEVDVETFIGKDRKAIFSAIRSVLESAIDKGEIK